MIFEKKDIQKLRDQFRYTITTEQEAAILDRFGRAPDDEHEWSQQDIYEQVRKMFK